MMAGLSTSRVLSKLPISLWLTKNLKRENEILLYQTLSLMKDNDLLKKTDMPTDKEIIKQSKTAEFESDEKDEKKLSEVVMSLTFDDTNIEKIYQR